MGAKALLTAGAAVFGALAAGLWFYASIVKVDHDRMRPSPIIKTEQGRRVDVLKTAEVQTRWNARAAAAASIAAVCQVALLWF